MGCSQPNMIAVRPLGSYPRVKFLGPRSQERDFSFREIAGEVIDIPCGKCDLCRVTRRYERALRIMLEAESWPGKTYFITLTYSDEFIGDGELRHSDWRQFVINFRQKFCQAKYCDISKPRHWKNFGKVRSHTFKEIKQVMCGEYGDSFGRRHFHGIIFNHTFSDALPTGTYSGQGFPILTSPSLSSVWKKGFVQVEEVNMDLALYVSSYVTDQALDDCPDFGHVKKQYGRFGRGIGRSWLEKYTNDVLVAGHISLSSGNYPIPRIFLRWMEEDQRFINFRLHNKLTSRIRAEKNILNGDGPLRRAKAKGRIFKSIHLKKERDYARKQFKS